MAKAASNQEEPNNARCNACPSVAQPAEVWGARPSKAFCVYGPQRTRRRAANGWDIARRGHSPSMGQAPQP
eukprot:7393026-Pyramimonas_sp.AAC.1